MSDVSDFESIDDHDSDGSFTLNVSLPYRLIALIMQLSFCSYPRIRKMILLILRYGKVKMNKMMIQNYSIRYWNARSFYTTKTNKTS